MIIRRGRGLPLLDDVRWRRLQRLGAMRRYAIGPAFEAGVKTGSFLRHLLVLLLLSCSLRFTGHGTKDRKSVVSGKSVSVRVDLGGRRIFTTKISNRHTYYSDTYHQKK